MRSFSWRVLIIVMALLASIICLLPNISSLPPQLAAILPSTAIKLGLDLKGGINLTLGVDVDKAMSNSLSLLGQDIRSSASEIGISIVSPRVNATGSLEMILPKADQAASMSTFLQERFGQLAVQEPAPLPQGGLLFSMTYRPEQEAALRNLVMDQTVRTLRNRIDQFGVAEPDIRQQGDNQIQIQLPGLNDPERAVQLIGQTAVLTFHRVRTDVAPGQAVPVGAAYYPHEAKDGMSGGLVLDKQPLLAGQDVADARPAFDEKNQPYVALQFNSRGAIVFERVTEELLHQPFAIVLDGKIQSAPVIQQKIAGGRASISGRFSTEQAQDLAIVLRAGSLPAPVKILEERTVGPSLGQESIQSGLLAGAVGALAVMLIMQLVYGRSGFQANLLLMFTVALLFAGLGVFGATLTLPGIAGVVLTIGMAVDANVLIFERIREELSRGASAAKAVAAGFDRASVSITDSNLTTIIAAVILYQFGTGPIRGFAVTLALGIMASMFTAIFVSRVMFERWVARDSHARLGIEPGSLPVSAAQ